MRGIGGSTLRGGQTVYHGLRMWGQLFKAAMMLAVFMAVAVPAWTLWRSPHPRGQSSSPATTISDTRPWSLVGAQMRYAIHDRDGWPLAMLGFSTAAWKFALRDRFIGWTPQLREKNLPFRRRQAGATR